MLLISWNVAGWSSTCKLIRDDFGSIQNFLQQTNADIVCLQEVKGSWSKLDSDPRGAGASDGGPHAIRGWESFWSFSSKQHRGFNGVATFVREGLTLWCDACPFKEMELNNEGRVVVTCHSAFVLINTYVVNARHGLRLGFKMRFLSALKDLIYSLKEETGKPVVLVGDLNQTYRPQDACWLLRRLCLPSMLELVRRAKETIGNADPIKDNNNNNNNNNNKEDNNIDVWEKEFPHLSRSTLGRLELFVAEQISLLLAATEEEQELSMPRSISIDTSLFDVIDNNNNNNNNNKGINNDSGEEEEKEEEEVVKVDALTKLIAQVRERKQQQQQQRKGNVGGVLATLEEICAAGIYSVFVEVLTRLQPPSHNRELFALIQYCGLPPHADISVQFMKNFITELHLCDVLLFTPPSSDESKKEEFIETCPCPYTCWDQSRNKRLTNEGTRIDYILIDEELTSSLSPCSRTENNIGISSTTTTTNTNTTTTTTNNNNIDNNTDCCGYSSSSSLPETKTISSSFFNEFDGSSLTIGVRRAMADGAYPAAPFDGSGLPPVTAAAKKVPFCGLPSTGLFITPPQYSDHCGVCAYFSGLTLIPRTGKVQERHEQRCYYRPPVSLHAFFAKHTRCEVETASEKVNKAPSQHMNSEEKKQEKEKQVRKLETMVIDVDDNSC